MTDMVAWLMAAVVYVGTSLDGYIADRSGGLEWLEMVPNPDGDDLGFGEFLDGVDAIVMGRSTFETVVGFDGPWPYPKPVFVLSRTLAEVPERASGRAEILADEPKEIIASLADRGFDRLYVDGGRTIQAFLGADCIDELIITRLPILLGEGVPLFGHLSESLRFEHLSTEVLPGQLVKSRYFRKRV